MNAENVDKKKESTSSALAGAQIFSFEMERGLDQTDLRSISLMAVHGSKRQTVFKICCILLVYVASVEKASKKLVGLLASWVVCW